ncbi:H-NS family nucleoid-associated regulatory protein [Burkholderia diffusa]|uniref:H-NS family nucleoid-associated regulatory protein n=1 Tax=Burkholderia diffusa TaxID=488732 RepID=UPI0009BD3D94|nr:H-NS family nucleoid-associated regulatory protein [Burkholderia diffusa]
MRVRTRWLSSQRTERVRPQAKYRDPKTDKTWSGRGRPPAWIAASARGRLLIQA